MIRITFTPIPSAALSTAPMGSDPGLRMNTSGVAHDESSKHAFRSNTGGLTKRSPIWDTTKHWTPVATLSARMHLFGSVSRRMKEKNEFAQRDKGGSITTCVCVCVQDAFVCKSRNYTTSVLTKEKEEEGPPPKNVGPLVIT